MQRRGSNLYRGWSGEHPLAIARAVGIGPLVRLGRSIIEQKADVAPDAIRWIMFKLANGAVVAPVEQPLIALGGLLDNLGDRAPSIFDVADHVMWDDPVLTPQMCRRFDSTSRDPTVALHYAYAVDRQQHAENGAITPAWKRGYNRRPFIAVLEQQDGDVEPTPVGIRIHGHDGDIGEIVQRRIDRDREILVSDVRTVTVIELDEPNADDMVTTLQGACQKLIDGGAVDP